MKKPRVSIVIPAYNEETNIRLGAIDKVCFYIQQKAQDWEIIVVDDGSTDDTPQLLDDIQKTNKRVRVIHNPHQGKASTVIAGMIEGEGDIILFSDLDQATPISEIEKILSWFAKGFDIVIGSRNVNREGAPLFRLIMARGFILLRTLFLGLSGISDTQCGFKAFRKPVAQDVFRRLQLYGKRKTVVGSMVTAGFDIEVLYLAKLLGYKIKEVSVEWHYVETRRVNPIKDSWQGLMDIITIRMNAWKGLYR